MKAVSCIFVFIHMVISEAKAAITKRNFYTFLDVFNPYSREFFFSHQMYLVEQLHKCESHLRRLDFLSNTVFRHAVYHIKILQNLSFHWKEIRIRN